MAKVKDSFRKAFKDNGEDVEVIVQWDVADDEEGYGVVIGSDTDDRTIAFGQGSLAYSLSHMLYQAIVNELEARNEELPEQFFHCDKLESLYDWQEERVLTDSHYVAELQKIVDYIQIWSKG